MNDKFASLFCHNYNNFSKHHISSIVDEYGLAKRDVLESHLWVYELYSHIQKYSGEKCVLKGGACAQLYLPLSAQRCTADIDAGTSLTPKELNDVLYSIRHEFNMKKFYTSYSEYIPEMVKRNGKTIPLMTFMFNIPFIFKGSKKKRFPALKIDFLFLDTERLDKHYITKGETIGLKLNYSPLCISAYSLICDKLLTFAVGSIGLEVYKTDGFYKNIYDLFYLVNNYNDIKSFEIICDHLKASASMEFEIKKMAPISINLLLEDILYTLYRISIRDLTKTYEAPSKRMLKFQENSLQRNIKEALTMDMWGIMAMYLYTWTTAVKEFILNGDSSKLNDINKILSQYEYFLTLSDKAQILFIKTLKNDIQSQDNRFFIEDIEEPLRLLYLHNIICE